MLVFNTANNDPMTILLHKLVTVVLQHGGVLNVHIFMTRGGERAVCEPYQVHEIILPTKSEFKIQ